MFSNFIRRNGKRKGNKVNESRSHHKSPSASSSLASSTVLKIDEESPQSAAQNPRLVELNLSDSNEEWFPQEFLRRRPPGSPRRAQNATVTVTQNDMTRETRADASSMLSSGRSEKASPGVDFRKKSIPAPILIPDAGLLMPNIQIGHSAVPTETSLNPSSPSASDNLSVISGATFAHALMGSSFVLSSSERHGSRHRSGVVRQDSATLPRGEVGFLSDPRGSSQIPPVPPVPTTLLLSRPSYYSAIKSGASTESEYPMSDSYITSSDIASPAISQQTSHTREMPLPTVSSTQAFPSAVPEAISRREGGRTQAVENGAFDVPEAAVEVPAPISIRQATQDSSQDRSFLPISDDHILDEFDFVPPQPLVTSTSSSSDSSISYIAPLPKRSDTNRGPRKRRFDGSNLVRNGSKDNSRPDGIPAFHGIPSMAMSEHDYGELLHYDLALTSESSAESHFPSSASAGYQTFPETPIVFSPLWSPEYAFFARSDSQLLCRCPPSPKSSARFGSGKLYSSLRIVKRQQDNNDGTGSAVVLRRSQSSSLLTGQRAPSPKQAESKLLSAQLNDKAVTTDETNRSLATNTVESQNPGKIWSVHSHPLARISSSGSFLLEEEALQALAPHSASSLTSPASVSLPESTDESPFNSPALRSFVPTTTAVTPPPSSNSPLSAPPSSSLGGSSFLPSPSPASLNESLPQPLSPTPNDFSRASLDKDGLASPSSFPPPPYHAVVSERTAHHPGPITPPLSRVSSTEHGHQRNRQASSSSTMSRVRARPPLPIGPRKPSVRGQVFDSFVPDVGGRDGSTSSMGSSDPVGNSGSLWIRLQSTVSTPPPRFQPPPPKWRGLTLEAAQWTFTSTQLQDMVSQAIQQASDGSFLRLLRLEVLDGEIADEMHRLEMEHTDVKAQYKALVRKRWRLMGILAGHIEGTEMSGAAMVSCKMGELAETLLALDRLADKMHGVVLQMAQLKSLRDVHNASALAMAVRKINGLFVRQMAEKERLQEQVDTLQTERDEAWKHAEGIAQDYDILNDRMSETAGASRDARVSVDAQSLAGTKRSERISAVRKSTIRLSQAGLRSRSRHRRSRSSSLATRPTSPVSEDIPPVPRLRVKPLSIKSVALSAPTGISLGSMYTGGSPTSEARALAEAQRDVYEMLGLSLPPSEASSRRRTLSGPDHLQSPSLSSRPVSDLLDTHAPRWRRRLSCEGGLISSCD